ncbi:MAG: hypothetical protein EB100_04320 [Crocinitomicaceae bacterium]|nr:hypothetical protein [Crocinitomicaceae bacterium]
MSNFWPNSSGKYRQLSSIALRDANLLPDALDNLSQSRIPIVSLHDWLENFEVLFSTVEADMLKGLLDKYGSDKAKGHDYHLLYSVLLKPTTRQVLEIGLGSNNRQIVSNMGIQGKPGASLRAFKEYLPEVNLIGLDVDSRILFSENRITTFFCDQLDSNSLNRLHSKLPDTFDLMIDDGLHSIGANLNSLQFFMAKLRVGGFAVIEDIPYTSIPVLRVVANLIKDRADCSILECKASFVFLARKRS